MAALKIDSFYHLVLFSLQCLKQHSGRSIVRITLQNFFQGLYD